MKKNLIRLLCIALSLVFVLSVFTGCGNQKPEAVKTESGSQGGQAEKPAKNAEDVKEPVELSFMHSWVAGTNDSVANAVITSLEKFTAENPNIKVNQEALPIDIFETKIKTLGAANELPDLFRVKGSMVRTFIDNEMMGSVDDILNSDMEWKNGFIQAAFGDFTVDGKIYGIPNEVLTTSLIFYNKKMFEKCGITSFPANWEEFKSAVTKLKQEGYIPIAMGNKGKWLSESCYLSTLGDRFTGTDWFFSIRDNKGAKFTDPEFINSLAAMQELARLGAFNSDLNSLDNVQQRTLYYNGKAAMVVEGSWAISAVAKEAPKEISEATAIAIIPAVEGGKGDSNAVSGGSAWAVNMSSKVSGQKKEAAAAVLKAISDKNYAKLVAENSGFPASKPADFDKSKVEPLVVQYNEMLQNLKFVPIYDAQLSPQVIEVMNSGLQELLINSVSPENLAKKIQAEYEK